MNTGTHDVRLYKKMDNIHTYTLPNGITIIHREVTHTRVLHCGFVLDIGSRDEDFAQEGLAHFWEHMAFKGTENRKSFHIINRLEMVGGDLNAYTTKEKIWYRGRAVMMASCPSRREGRIHSAICNILAITLR